MRAWTPSSVFDRWAEEGPLRHEPTGLAIDDWTDGGPVYGTRWYLLGAPDAGKTALATQIADTYARRGMHVGILAVDEEPGDLQTRLLQRRGFTRRECEERDPNRLRAMRKALRDLPIRYYGDDYTIENAAINLAREAKGKPIAMFVDSVQTVTCDAIAKDEGDLTERAQVTANVRAIRFVATEHRMIVIATSEMNRAAYRTIEQSDASRKTGDMAAGKESGAIEYSGRVILSLRAVEGSADLIEVMIAKNKHGPSRETFFLNVDRARMTLTTGQPPAVELTNAKALKKNAQNAARLAVFLASHQGVTKNELHAGLRARYGAFGEGVANVALATLGAVANVALATPGTAVLLVPLPNRAQGHHLDGSKVGKDILELIKDAGERKLVKKARWPAEGEAQ